MRVSSWTSAHPNAPAKKCTRTRAPADEAATVGLDESYVVLGLDSVWVKRNTAVHSGNIGADQGSYAGPYACGESDVLLGSGVNASGVNKIVGNRITVPQDANVSEIFYKDSLETGEGNAIATTAQLGTAHFPVFPSTEQAADASGRSWDGRNRHRRQGRDALALSRQLRRCHPRGERQSRLRAGRVSHRRIRRAEAGGAHIRRGHVSLRQLSRGQAQRIAIRRPHGLASDRRTARRRPSLCHAISSPTTSAWPAWSHPAPAPLPIRSPHHWVTLAAPKRGRSQGRGCGVRRVILVGSNSQAAHFQGQVLRRGPVPRRGEGRLR